MVTSSAFGAQPQLVVDVAEEGMVRVAVVGRGMIGAACAWRIQSAGYQVTSIDPGESSAAASAAGGMLAPVSELAYGERHIHEVGLKSLDLYPAFVEALSAATGINCGLRQSGTILVGFSQDDAAALQQVLELHQSLGVAGERLRPSEARLLEAGLSPRIRSAVHVPGDRHVDAQQLHHALVQATTSSETVVRAKATHVTKSGQSWVVECEDGQSVVADAVVVAAGAHSSFVSGLPAIPVRPVFGTSLQLTPRSGFLVPLKLTVRAEVHGRPVYLVPKVDGSVIVGASSYERGFTQTVTVNEVHDLLRAAVEVVPECGELELADIRRGWRPATPDHAPIVCSVEPGLIVATGHYRNGVLLAPWTADLVHDLLHEPTMRTEFELDRFESEASSS